MALAQAQLQSESFIARRTENSDADKIAKLVTRHTETVFGRVDVEYIIEHANLSITLVGVDSGEVLGHMALFDYPNLRNVDQAEWENWLHENYQCKKASPVNTLFVHLFAAKEGFSQGANAELLRATFMAVPLLQYVFLTTPSGTNLGSALASQMSIVFSNSEEPATDMYVAERFEHFPMLHIRPAVVEDADDLMPIFTQYSSEVAEEYGEFFLAELIASQDDHHKTIIADVGGRAIGFLSVTTQVDADLLNSCYQLEPFHGLKHPVPEDEIKSTSTMGSDSDNGHTNSFKIAPAASESQGASSSGDSGLLPHTHQASSQQSISVPVAIVTQPDRLEGGEEGRREGEEREGEQERGGEEGKEGEEEEVVGSEAANVSQHSIVVTSDMEQQETEKNELGSQISNSSGSSSSNNTGSTHSKPESKSSLVQEPPPTEQLHPPQGEAMAPADQETADTSPEGGRSRPRRKEYTFRGSCNALAVQLFAIDDKYETRSMDLLPAVFNLFPGHDFLLLSQPHSFPEFPLLSNFTRVPPRVRTSVSQELYVLHKCGLLHSFSVSPVTADDVPQIARLSAELSGCSELMEDITRYVQARRDPLQEGATPISAMVARCANQVVGVVVLRQEQEMRYIRSHYNIEDFIYYDYHLPTDHAHLHHFLLNPVFASYAKHFIKECLRISHKTSLYYPLSPTGPLTDGNGRPHSIITALSHMVPVRPRRQVVYSLKHVGANAPLDEVLKELPPFALYHTNRKLTLEPKITVNSRVVVVGASDTALALLESLVFCPHLYFTNITLVSPHPFFHPTPPPPPSPSPSEGGLGGSEGGSGDSSSRLKWPGMIASSLCFSQRQCSLLGLGTWVNMARHKMVAINRPAQHIVVESSADGEHSLVHYDYLVLCTGTQYQPPKLSVATTCPGNLFTVNNHYEASSLQHWVREKYLPDPKDNLVVYGNNLDAYGITQALLDCGVPPDKLLLVRPNSDPLSPDPTVQGVLQRGLEEAGVKALDGATLHGWMVDDGGTLTGLRLQAESCCSELTCQGMVYAEEKTVDAQAFKAMNDACLVFDRRLVIYTNHATNDPLIFAAGPVTKFSRRYRADQWTHACYNSYEVGQRLALTMLTKLDPTAEPWTDPSHNLDPELIPTYTNYKATAVCLPGGYHYLHVHAPHPEGEDESSSVKEGHDLRTDTEENGYMYLHLNEHSCVDQVVALSPRPLWETDNYLCLYGLHECYLNSVLRRYEVGTIPDLYEFFRQPWACAVFHDRFGDLLEEIKEQLGVLPVKEEESLMEHMKGMLKDDPHLPLAKYRPYLSALFNDSAARDFVEKKLFKYLHYNSHHLPMYAKPDML